MDIRSTKRRVRFGQKQTLAVQQRMSNQYVVDSKSLGEHGRTVAIHPASPYRRAIKGGYPYLQAMGESLRSAGVWFEDLTPMFAGMEPN